MISLIRIDDRLIHGQVMAVWVRALSVTHILVIDDATAADAFTRQVMHLAMPAGMALTISTLGDAACDGAAGHLARFARDSSRTLVLLKSVSVAKQLHAHFPFNELNVGGIGMAPGRRLIWRSIAASQEEIDQLKALSDAGVDVYLQMIPADPRQPLAGIL
jgi:PTS system mannose-specific IIB component